MAEKCKTRNNRPSCPYCDKEIKDAALPYCEPCHKTILYCPQCHKPVSSDEKTCPKCGAKIK
jgi:hypothetical protein